MKKISFLLVYFLTPSIPVFLYLRSSGFILDSYSFSIVAGVYAFILLCNQFILAARPSPAVAALGLKGLLSFHSSMAFLVLALAVVHRALKMDVGFSFDTLQATLGAVVWWVFFFTMVFAVLFMANTFILKIEFFVKFKRFVMQSTHLTYNGARIVHNITVPAGIGILIHVVLASSSNFTANPSGLGYMVVWMLFSLLFYFGYRLKHRTNKGK